MSTTEFQFYRVGNCLIETEQNMIIHLRNEQVIIEMQNLPPINLNKQHFPKEYEQYKALYDSSPLFVEKCI